MIRQAFGITIPLDTATPAVARVIAGLSGSTNLARYGGRKVQREIGEHLLSYAAAHHKTAQSLGAAPTGFLADAYESVTSPGALVVEPNRAILNLPRNAFARAFGDVDIVPGAGKKYLTFAAVSFAYGKRAQSFANLTFGLAYDPKTGRLRAALVEAAATKIKIGRPRKDGSRKISQGESTTGHAPVFWLVRRAHQAQDRNLLPTNAEINAAALEGAAEYVTELIRQKGGGS